MALGGAGRSDRRWAGAFRLCAACGGRNWVGAQRCRSCSALLLGQRAVGRPPVAMVGRRMADRVMTRRVKAAALGSLALALGAGFLILRLLRTDAIQTSPVLADSSAAPTPPSLDAPVAAASEPAPPPSAAEGLRNAQRGRTLLDRGNVKGAVAALTDAARVLPNDAEIAHLLGAALWRYGAQDHALFQLRRALLLARDNAVFREDLARALQGSGHAAEAAHLLRDGETLGASTLPPDPVALAPAAALAEARQGAGDAVNMGGAGRGTYSGRTSFTDADLHPARPPMATPVPASPAPESQQ